MPLSWNEIKSKALGFSKTWADAASALSGGKKTWKNDAERVAYLFELYQRYTSLLPTYKKKPVRKKA